MKITEFTQEHASKLLEMCKTLFPEHLWGFGGFPTSEIGADYVGMEYLDVTHINHKIPCIKSRYKIGKDSSDLKVVQFDGKYPEYDKIEDGYINNISGDQSFFTQKNGEIVQGANYEETYIEGIHWFEFCMTKIAPKLLNSLGDYADLCTGENGLGHPIDYLYEQFKNSQK